MPPVETKLTEDDRLRVSNWIENRLRQTACDAGEYAGAVALRRLNRREYHNTIRDLLGVDFNVAELFPIDGTGGAGFDTNGETLFIPPLLMERYLTAVSRFWIAPSSRPTLLRRIRHLRCSRHCQLDSLTRSCSWRGTFGSDIDLSWRRLRCASSGTADLKAKLALKVDGATSVPLVTQAPRGPSRDGAVRIPTHNVRVRLARGFRMLSIVSEDASAPVVGLTLTVIRSGGLMTTVTTDDIGFTKVSFVIDAPGDVVIQAAIPGSTIGGTLKLTVGAAAVKANL